MVVAMLVRPVDLAAASGFALAMANYGHRRLSRNKAVVAPPAPTVDLEPLLQRLDLLEKRALVQDLKRK